MKIPPRLSLFLLDVLDLLEDSMFIASRPGLGRMSRYWGYTEMRSAYRAFQRWELQKYLEAEYKGDQVLYRLGKKGSQLLNQWRPSPASRHRKWDGRWRMVMFDFPEPARKARDAFRRLLREHHLGALQKSVWISPDPIIPEWKRLLAESKLTEWVLLFESAELGPVTDIEIARKVWPLDDLDKGYGQYLSQFRELPGRLGSARFPALEGELGRLLRRESGSYLDLLWQDPLLPKTLLPADFHGAKADELHREVRCGLRRLLSSAKP